MADDLTAEQVKEFRDAFIMFDKNQDGAISAKELGTVLRSLGQNPTEKEIEDLINQVDTNGSGNIDFNEFLTVMANKLKEVDNEEEVREAFRVFDMDHDSNINVSEIRRVFEQLKAFGENLDDEEIEELLADADINGDGQISYDEFIKLFTIDRD